MSTGGTALTRINKQVQSGPPFVATSADNGLSVDAVSGHIVLGNDTGGAAAALLSNREIPQAAFNLKLLSVFPAASAATALTLDSIIAAGTPTQLEMTVHNPTSAAGGTVLNLREIDGGGAGSMLSIPTRAARVEFQGSGVRISTLASQPGGLTLTGTPAISNYIIFNTGFTMANSGALMGAAVDVFTIAVGTGNQIQPTAGTFALVVTNSSFGPLAGNAVCALFEVRGAIDQSAGGTGITRGIYIDPALNGAVDYRALEIKDGGILVGAGTAGISRAPFKYTAGVAAQAVVEDGAKNFDGSNETLAAGGVTYTLAKTLTATGVLDFPNTLTLTSSDLTIALNGAAIGDVVLLGVDNASVLANSCYTAWVSAANTVTVRFSNYSVAAQNPASGTFRVSIVKY
jgi:hypothetical protein